mmetsp:Transcript_3371/g.6313  ORF Transcript_3371/g.6313 Transcript_3371/m.6313 type:complete len:207 (+) Transcript_3371:273-893(+)
MEGVDARQRAHRLSAFEPLEADHALLPFMASSLLALEVRQYRDQLSVLRAQMAIVVVVQLQQLLKLQRRRLDGAAPKQHFYPARLPVVLRRRPGRPACGPVAAAFHLPAVLAVEVRVEVRVRAEAELRVYLHLQLPGVGLIACERLPTRPGISSLLRSICVFTSPAGRSSASSRSGIGCGYCCCLCFPVELLLQALGELEVVQDLV